MSTPTIVVNVKKEVVDYAYFHSVVGDCSMMTNSPC